MAKNARKKKQVSQGPPQKKTRPRKRIKQRQVRLATSFAKAVLDPFSVRGARVPDGYLLRTATAYGRTYGMTIPAYNFTTGYVYGIAHAAPIYSNSAKPFYTGASPSGTSSYFDFSANATPTTVDFTKTWGTTGSAINEPSGAMSAMRVVGGGISLRCFGIKKDDPVEVYMVPLFNGDKMPSNFGAGTGVSIKHYTVTDDSNLVVGFPLRSKENSYEWVASGKTGTLFGHYPANDDITQASDCHNAIVCTGNTDCTTANTAVRGFSLQSGLGAVTLYYRIPPGVGVQVEMICHIEYIPQTLAADIYAAESLLEVEASNQAEIEAVSNAAAAISHQDVKVIRADTCPLTELRELGSQAKSQMIAGASGALEDTQVLNWLTYGAVTATAATIAARVRNLRLR